MDQIKEVFAKRLKELRIKNNQTQKDMCKQFSIYCKSDKVLPISTLSSWELGNKHPAPEMLVKIAGFFDVSIDYLYGLTEDVPLTENINLIDKQTEIRKCDLKYYHKEPVYISNGTNCLWGIYDRNEDCFHSCNCKIMNTYDLKYYVIQSKNN